jgi:hypothetical protein
MPLPRRAKTKNQTKASEPSSEIDKLLSSQKVKSPFSRRPGPSLTTEISNRCPESVDSQPAPSEAKTPRTFRLFRTSRPPTFLTPSRCEPNPYRRVMKRSADPLRIIEYIRDRIESIAADAIDRILDVDISDIDAISECDKTILSLLELTPGQLREARARICHGPSWKRYQRLLLQQWFVKLKREANRSYDSPALRRVKWINSVNFFSRAFGIPIEEVQTYVKISSDISNLKTLYQYFYYLFLDLYCMVRLPERCEKLFPNKFKIVLDESLDLKTPDTYENFCDY